jgi:hypothetical protein
MEISKIYQSNIYLDGTNSLLGKASEVTLPDIVAVTDTHQALGMIGKVELPSGLDVLVTKIKWTSFWADRIAMGANPFKAHKLQVRANVETFGADGRTGEEALVALLTCRFKKSPLGVFAPQANPQFEDELATTYVKVTLGKRELLEVDVIENIWRANGVDILSAYRSNLGL